MRDGGQRKRLQRAAVLLPLCILVSCDSGSNGVTDPGIASATSVEGVTPEPRMSIVRLPRPTKTPFPPTLTPTSPPRTPTFTPIPTSTPIPPPPSPTQTPSPLPAITLGLRGIPWQWDFSGPAGVSISTTGPYLGQNTIVLQKGQTYKLYVYDDAFQEDRPHYFSGVAAIGLSGTRVAAGASPTILTFTPTTTGLFPFLCTNVCGSSSQHDSMQGFIRVFQ
jgi:hypothetical protein